MNDLVIVDTGGANLSSVQIAFERLGAKPIVSRDPGAIASARRVVLPGVGAARDAMERLDSAGLLPVLRDLRAPVLGICLGMQLLFDASEEGDVACLGVMPGRVRGLVGTPSLPVPHMGWSRLEALSADPLFEGIEPGDYVYFVHSFAADLDNATIARAAHGRPFSAAVRRGSFAGVQFHPERSGAVGGRILNNFLSLEPPLPCA